MIVICVEGAGAGWTDLLPPDLFIAGVLFGCVGVGLGAGVGLPASRPPRFWNPLAELKPKAINSRAVAIKKRDRYRNGNFMSSMVLDPRWLNQRPSHNETQ